MTQDKKGYEMKKRNVGFFAAGLCLAFGVQRAAAVDTLCAEVQIEVQQEATLIRQGFDAHMRINNGLPSISLQNVAVTVQITDADGNEVETTSVTTNNTIPFFVRVDYTEGIYLPVSSVITNGTVTNASSADLHWLIIPTLNAGVSNQYGKVFYVGATLTYTLDGKEQSVTVAPDSIVVKPLPELTLDYFLPETVYGDDPVKTPDIIEASVPFSLGVLLRNTGYGTAKNMKISSAQPEIVQNSNGLLVGFTITGTEVNGKASGNSLLVDFGTVDPGGAALARWIMQCSLYGTFTNFTAEFTHDDELGGMLTSLIQSNGISTHVLLHDVKVDLPGQDSIRDFLTADMHVYESDGTVTTVTNLSSVATRDGSGTSYTITGISDVSGPLYYNASNLPLSGLTLQQVKRSDGKVIGVDNRWISQSRITSTSEWIYAFNLFDVNPPSGSCYTVSFVGTTVSNTAPKWDAMGGQIAYAERKLQFTVHASDTNNDHLTLNALGAPGVFTDFGDGSGCFSWTPGPTDAGSTSVTFVASDGPANSMMDVAITVRDWNIPTNCPAWWYNHDLIVTNAVVNDFAPVNQGQLKNIAWAAYKEMEKLYGGTNGTAGAGFVLTATNNANNYLPVNIGQAKAIVTNFYDRMKMDYPWLNPTNSVNDFAMANIGQIKNLFSFDPLKDDNDNGIPDWWEEFYGSTNRAAYFNNTIP